MDDNKKQYSSVSNNSLTAAFFGAVGTFIGTSSVLLTQSPVPQSGDATTLAIATAAGAAIAGITAAFATVAHNTDVNQQLIAENTPKGLE